MTAIIPHKVVGLFVGQGRGGMGKLTNRKVETAKPGKHGDGEGLQLVVTASGSRKWGLRFMLAGRAREMGLGSFPEVSLRKRGAAFEARRLIAGGKDPIEAREAARKTRLRLARPSRPLHVSRRS